MFFSIFAGMSISTLLFLLIVSFVFKFCLYHRVFLYYATIIDVLNWIDYLYVIPFTIDLMSITKLEIGGGKVKIGIPLSDKAISLDEKDLLSFKEGISNII